MELTKLFEIQAKLEQQMMVTSGINEKELSDDEVVNIRFLALNIKVGELANLTKCYKYLHDLKKLPKEKVLFRYVEGIRYLISLGNKYDLSLMAASSKEERPLVELFSDVFDVSCALKQSIKRGQYVESVTMYRELFVLYLTLGKTLGVTYEEAYHFFEERS